MSGVLGLTPTVDRQFPRTLPSRWQQPPVLRPLGHHRSLEVSGGLVSGLARTVGPGHQPGAELVWPAPPPGPTVRPAPDQTADAPARPVAGPAVPASGPESRAPVDPAGPAVAEAPIVPQAPVVPERIRPDRLFPPVADAGWSAETTDVVAEVASGTAPPAGSTPPGAVRPSVGAPPTPVAAPGRPPGEDDTDEVDVGDPPGPPEPPRTAPPVSPVVVAPPSRGRRALRRTRLGPPAGQTPPSPVAPGPPAPPSEPAIPAGREPDAGPTDAATPPGYTGPDPDALGPAGSRANTMADPVPGRLVPGPPGGRPPGRSASLAGTGEPAGAGPAESTGAVPPAPAAGGPASAGPGEEPGAFRRDQAVPDGAAGGAAVPGGPVATDGGNVPDGPVVSGRPVVPETAAGRTDSTPVPVAPLVSMRDVTSGRRLVSRYVTAQPVSGAPHVPGIPDGPRSPAGREASGSAPPPFPAAAVGQAVPSDAPAVPGPVPAPVPGAPAALDAASVPVGPGERWDPVPPDGGAGGPGWLRHPAPEPAATTGTPAATVDAPPDLGNAPGPDLPAGPVLRASAPGVPERPEPGRLDLDADPMVLDALARQLYGRMRGHLATDLLVDRERAQLLTDLF